MAAERWCNDCAWPEACAARLECRRREAGEVRAAMPFDGDLATVTIKPLCVDLDDMRRGQTVAAEIYRRLA